MFRSRSLSGAGSRSEPGAPTMSAPGRCPRSFVPAVLIALGTTVAGVLATAVPAGAHVTVNPREAEQGGYARVAFRVPTESDTANTTKVELFLPEDAPIASVSTMPVPGWTVRVDRKPPAKPVTAHGEKLTEVVSKITWTAGPGAEVKPGQFQEFPVSLGPLPEADTLVFKALQTYSDGTVVRWIEAPSQGQPEPEKPAPVLKLTPEGDGGSGGGAGSTVAAAGDSAAGDSDDSGPALVVAILGLLVGLLGAGLGGLALRRSRRPAA